MPHGTAPPALLLSFDVPVCSCLRVVLGDLPCMEAPVHQVDSKDWLPVARKDERRGMTVVTGRGHALYDGLDYAQICRRIFTVHLQHPHISPFHTPSVPAPKDSVIDRAEKEREAEAKEGPIWPDRPECAGQRKHSMPPHRPLACAKKEKKKEKEANWWSADQVMPPPMSRSQAKVSDAQVFFRFFFSVVSSAGLFRRPSSRPPLASFPAPSAKLWAPHPLRQPGRSQNQKKREKPHAAAGVPTKTRSRGRQAAPNGAVVFCPLHHRVATTAASIYDKRKETGLKWKKNNRDRKSSVAIGGEASR